MSVYRRDIDGLRAVAVVPVVLYHAGLPAISGGFVGVDVFFVISGYLITGIIRDELDTKSFSLFGFYERRARRILPALFFMIAACFVAGWFILTPSKLIDLAKSVAATTIFSSNIWFWQETSGGYFAEASEFMPLLHTWSLAVEEQFYILFPLLLMAVSARRRAVTLLTIGGAFLASLAIAIVAVERWPSAAFYMAPTRAWELGLGALAALGTTPRLQARWPREVLAAAGLVAILSAVFFFDNRTPFPGVAALLPCLGALAIVVAGSIGRNLVSSVLSWRPFVFFGTISYSLYLWHWPILSFLRSRLGAVDLSLVHASAAVVASVIIATISWAVVERPFRNRAFLQRDAVFALSGATMAATAVIAAVLWIGSGIPSRMPQRAIAFAAASGDINPLRTKCFDRYPGSEAAGDLCRLGSWTTGSVDFLFWGDSHSDALFPGMDLAARISGKRGLYVGTSSCQPLLGVDRTDPRFKGCRAFNDAVIETLLRRGDVGTVVLHSRWAIRQVDSRSNEDKKQGVPPAITDDEDPGLQGGDTAAVFERGLRRTVEAVIASGRDVVILGGTPEFGWDVPTKLYLEAAFGDPLPVPLDLSDVARRNAGVNSLFERLAENPHVRIVPLAPTLCNPQCMVSYQGQSLFVDEHHLSAFAARELMAPLLARELFGEMSTLPSPAATSSNLSGGSLPSP